MSEFSDLPNEVLLNIIHNTSLYELSTLYNVNNRLKILIDNELIHYLRGLHINSIIIPNYTSPDCIEYTITKDAYIDYPFLEAIFPIEDDVLHSLLASILSSEIIFESNFKENSPYGSFIFTCTNIRSYFIGSGSLGFNLKTSKYYLSSDLIIKLYKDIESTMLYGIYLLQINEAKGVFKKLYFISETLFFEQNYKNGKIISFSRYQIREQPYLLDPNDIYNFLEINRDLLELSLTYRKEYTHIDDEHYKITHYEMMNTRFNMVEIISMKKISNDIFIDKKVYNVYFEKIKSYSSTNHRLVKNNIKYLLIEEYLYDTYMDVVNKIKYEYEERIKENLTSTVYDSILLNIDPIFKSEGTEIYRYNGMIQKFGIPPIFNFSLIPAEYEISRSFKYGKYYVIINYKLNYDISDIKIYDCNTLVINLDFSDQN